MRKPSVISDRAASRFGGSEDVADTKLDAIFAIGQHEAELGHLFVKAEQSRLADNFVEAHTIYQQYIAKCRINLRVTEAFNALYPDTPFTIDDIVRRLANGLLVDADIVQALGDSVSADSSRKDAIEISRKYLGRSGTAEVERSLAGTLTLAGRFNEAISALMRARDCAIETQDALTLAQVAIDFTDVFQWLGDLTRATNELNHANAIIDQQTGKRRTTSGMVIEAIGSISDPLARPDQMANLKLTATLFRATNEVIYFRGLVGKALRQWDEAEDCFRQVLPEYQSLGAGEAIEYQLAQIDAGRGEWKTAFDRLRSIAPAFERGKFVAKRGVFKRVQAECLHALGNTIAALQLVKESIQDLSDQYFDPDALWRSQRLQATLCRSSNDNQRAIQSLRDAIGTIEQLRQMPLGYRLDSTFLQDKTELYHEAIVAAARLGQAADCCGFIESLKSRTLRAILSSPRAEVGADLKGKFDQVTAALDAGEYQAYREGWTFQRKLARSTLLRQRAEILERIRIEDPRWRALSHAPRLDFDAALKVLGTRSQAAITIYYEPPNLIAVLLFDGKLTVGTLDVSEKLSKDLTEFATNLQKSKPNFYAYDFASEYSVQAKNLIPLPLLSEALKARSLLVIPHGILHLVPWATLPHEGKRLFERLPVGILPNLAAAVRQAHPGKPRGVCLLGVARYSGLKELGDLPNVEGEISDVLQLYAGKNVPAAKPKLDREVTEKAFWELMRSVAGPGNVLHVSCHGVSVANEPMNSGLLLFDSKIDAAKIANAEIPFDEVVLSACSTGWRPTAVDGVMLAADEILGIPAGFLEAGVKSVLVSIPQAEGRAARAFTTHYHTRRLLGEPPLASFRSAQQYMLDSGAPAHTWAGFAMYGSA